MARYVPMRMNGPSKIEPQEKAISVCGCGLSKMFPFCDGAHKGCRGVETDPDAVYVYDAEGRIVETRKGDGTAREGGASA